ncbi:MAG: low molecular weight protein-tyrosine-phosphatase [Erythrobacter sp.]
MGSVPRIMCVCLGNICRSPTAEAVLRQKSGARLKVDSAGTGGWHIGDPPHGPMIKAAAARGYDLHDLRGRKVTKQDFERFDLILAMDEQNKADLEALRPNNNDTPVTLMMSFAPDTGVSEVPDPYYTGDFDHALDLIEAASKGLLQSLN